MKQMSWPGLPSHHHTGWLSAVWGCVPSCYLGWRIAQPLPPPAVRTATRQPKEIEFLLVLASAANSVVKRVRDLTSGRCQMAELPPPPEGIVLTHFIVSDDVERSRRFYTEVLGGRVEHPGDPVNVALANSS